MKERLLRALQNFRGRINHNWTGGAIGAAIAFVLGFGLLDYRINDTPIGQRLIELSYELPFSLRGTQIPSEVMIVYQDEDSAAHLEEPLDGAWDRKRHAQLLERLKADGAKAVVFDLVFADNDPDAPPSPSDQAFAEAIRTHGNVVLGTMVQQVEVQGAPQRMLVLPDASFRDSGAKPGLVTFIPGADRTIRQHFHGFPPGELALDLASLSWTTAAAISHPTAASPTDRFRSRWINYYGPPGTIPFYNYHFVIETNFASGTFHNKIVFVGARQSIGFLGTGLDEFRSPYALRSALRNLSHPGVEIHATMFANLLRQDWLRRVSPWIELAILSVVAVFSFCLVLTRPLSATLWAIFAAGMSAVIASYLFIYRQTWFASLIVMTQIGAAWFWSVVFNSVRLFVQKRLMEQSLSMYVSPSRVKQIAKRPDILKPGAEKQVVTVLFSDIANFTTISEGMDSDVLARLMNNYFEAAVTHCIQKADGCVVKFIGDAIFAIWNAPEPQADHQIKACHGALLLRDKVTEFMKEQAEGLKLVTRIGLHTGVANVGNFGSSRRIDYTAIGENINLASRMEGLNKYVGTTVLITRDTRDGIGDHYITRLVGHFRLKGFERVVEVYELVGTADQAEQSRAWREIFTQALEQFQKRNFDVAESGFRKTIEAHPDDGPAQFYLKHIVELRADPPEDDWAGDIELKEK